MSQAFGVRNSTVDVDDDGVEQKIELHFASVVSIEAHERWIRSYLAS